MPVDYSKWDALELSDDSDFEPHPNVDKRSFIRAKQNQIHQKRAERKNHIETLKYERIINDGLLRRIDTLLTELRNHEAEAKDRNAFIYQALITSAGDPDDDEPPKPPAGVHIKEDQPRYSQMMGHLVDQVKKEVDDAKPENWYKAFVKSVDGHKKKVAGLQKELNTKLDELEKEESRKITSESIHDGFNASSVTKDKLAEKNPTSTKSKPKAETVEVLNPASLKKDAFKSQDEAQSSGADADTEGVDDPDDTDETMEPTALGKQFGRIRMGDYSACLQFISEHRQVLAERETDGLLIMAFHAEEKGDSKLAKQYVHHALLLQYCRSLGGDGVRLFFKRVTTQGHQAQKVFLDDVNNTFQRMKTRTAELSKERQTEVETIQLQAVEPGTEIHFNVPQPDSEEEIEQQARAIFETFPPGLQRALESGSLDRVNEVLGKMSIEEAEEIVGQLGESGMLDMRQGVIDTTTEEGKEELKQIHEQQEGELVKHREDIEIADPD
ncbi:hsp90 co-chaperone Cdc37 [Xylographa pallens]|nr:hsp90 co-chaperone Cdc37 [Xylographa pallens]